MENCFVIITAGGTGSRLNKAVPKQFLMIGGKPVLFYAIEQFYHAIEPSKIILTLPEEYRTYWENLCRENQLTIPHEVIPGGDERFHSVKTALSQIPREEGIVGIHDGVRPFTSQGLIQAVFEEAKRSGAALPALPLRDSIRQNYNNHWVSKDRRFFRRIQTPQAFALKPLKEAYKLDWDETFTDDLTVWEYAGNTFQLVKGEERNFKITNALDLEFAEFLSQNLEIK